MRRYLETAGVDAEMVPDRFVECGRVPRLDGAE